MCEGPVPVVRYHLSPQRELGRQSSQTAQLSCVSTSGKKKKKEKKRQKKQAGSFFSPPETRFVKTTNNKIHNLISEHPQSRRCGPSPLPPPEKEKKYQIKSRDKLSSLWVRRRRLGSDSACRWMNAPPDWQPQTERARRSTAKPQKPLSHGPPDTVQLQCAPNSELSETLLSVKSAFLGLSSCNRC